MKAAKNDRDQRVLVLGFGLSGVASARYLCQRGAKVTVADQKSAKELEESLKQCEGLPLTYEFGKHQTSHWTQFDRIVLSPGISKQHALLQEVRSKGIPITTELQLAFSEIREPILCVTGTNGKTTTTSLLAAMLEAAGHSVFVGGNIGRPLLNYVLEKKKAHYVVVEISSFQIELLSAFEPRGVIFTNLEPDHLDRYGTFENYIEAKKRLLEFCTPKTFVVSNAQGGPFKQWKGRFRQLWFSKQLPELKTSSKTLDDEGSFYDSKSKSIFFQTQGKLEKYEAASFQLFGLHNKENLMAALSLAKMLDTPQEAIEKVIKNFKPIPHRLEFVRKKEGVFFFNDSKGTNPMSVQKSLEAFQSNHIILIAGGKDKNSDFSGLVPLLREKCKILILLGEAKEKMNRVLGDHTETYLVGTFEEAVLLAYQKSRNGDIVLLSPGCASYDAFKNYEERGEYFKKLVYQL